VKHYDSNYLSRVDLSKEFWESELHEQSHAKSAFITLFGQYECTVMQFGMKTSSLTFDRPQSLIEPSFFGLLHGFLEGVNFLAFGSEVSLLYTANKGYSIRFHEIGVSGV
jgi:hypothetical protein